MVDNEITLSRREMEEALWRGGLRRVNAIMRNGHNRAVLNSHGKEWNAAVEGAGGECAVAKYLNIEWLALTEGEYVKDAPDLISREGKLLEVRTRTNHEYELFVEKKDRDDRYYILVTGKMPTYRIRGYMLGKNAKRTEWLKSLNGNPHCYFVPTEFLLPMPERKKNVRPIEEVDRASSGIRDSEADNRLAVDLGYLLETHAPGSSDACRSQKEEPPLWIP